MPTFQRPTPEDLPPEPVDTTNEFGKGALPTPDAIKSTQYVLAATAPPFIDWSKPYRVPANLTQKNQDGSSSCTAQAANYYVEALSEIEHAINGRYSSRWIYSQTWAPPTGGAYIWKAMSIPLLYGVAELNSVPEGNSDETIMRDTSANGNAVLQVKTDKYSQLATGGRDINYLASIVKDYHGFITGFNGWDGMFSSDGTVIDWSKNQWGHAVFICGYEIHNGQKCLVFKNSWGSSWGDDGYGYMPEAFLASGMVFDAYVYAEVQDLDPTTVMLTAKHVRELQALEGYKDEAGVLYWTGKMLTDYLRARLPDKVRTINEAMVSAGPEPVVVPVVLPPSPEPVIVKQDPVPAPVFSIGDIAAALAGAGLTQISTNLNVALLLIGVGVGLKVLVAVLNRFGVPLSARKK